LGLIPAQNER